VKTARPLAPGGAARTAEDKEGKRAALSCLAASTLLLESFATAGIAAANPKMPAGCRKNCSLLNEMDTDLNIPL
jgi:hypothetical protein